MVTLDILYARFNQDSSLVSKFMNETKLQKWNKNLRRKTHERIGRLDDGMTRTYQHMLAVAWRLKFMKTDHENGVIFKSN